PGVTVDKKEGTLRLGDRDIEVLDLPGAYSLVARSPDEAVTRDILLGRRADTPPPDLVLAVVDASNLERNLYLALQIADLGVHVATALQAERGLEPEAAAARALALLTVEDAPPEPAVASAVQLARRQFATLCLDPTDAIVEARYAWIARVREQAVVEGDAGPT